ncbi:MAG: trypsin-like peptidase domain-containing protein [Cyanobacteria bacterium P01_A01_bin.17]
MTALSKFPTVLLGAAAAVTMVLPQAAQALSPAEVSQMAKSFTVRIRSQSSGSGVILKRQGDLYTVLTAAHVVASDDDYRVITPDGREHTVNTDSIKKLPGLDLSIVQFSSKKSYQTAQIGESDQAAEGTISYIAGFPNRTEALPESIYNFTEGKITASASRPQAEGYSLVYSNNTLPGMSGGPVLNEAGKLIAIHGRADITEQAQNPNIDPSIYIKTGFNLGIPIKRFLSLVPQTGMDLGFAVPTPPSSSSERSADDYYLQASEKMDKKDYEGAIANLDQAIRLKPNYAAAHLNRGYAHFFLNQTEAALADSNKVIQLAPNQSTAYLLRGLIYSLSGENIGKAPADFKRAQTLAKAQGDSSTSQTAQKMIASLKGSSDKPSDSPDLKSSMIRSGLHIANKDTKRVTQELPTLANLSCKEQNLSGYLIAKMMLRMLTPADSHGEIASQTSCPTFVKDQTKLLDKAEQKIKASPNEINAYMERGLIHAEILGDTQRAIPDIQKAVKLSITQKQQKNSKGALIYLRSLQP